MKLESSRRILEKIVKYLIFLKIRRLEALRRTDGYEDYSRFPQFMRTRLKTISFCHRVYLCIRAGWTTAVPQEFRQWDPLGDLF